MNTVLGILVLIIGAVLFGLFHKIFRVTYFGFQGMLTVGIVCLLIAFWIVSSIFGV
jgi:hypothetical protein